MSHVKPFIQSRHQTKAEAFMHIAEHLATLSCCKVRQHAAIIVPLDFSNILAIGYNGPARGLPNDTCSGLDHSACDCVHAEVNSLVKLRTEQKNLVMFMTKSPCLECMKLIINSGAIRLLVHKEAWSRGAESIDMLVRAESEIASISIEQAGESIAWLQEAIGGA